MMMANNTRLSILLLIVSICSIHSFVLLSERSNVQSVVASQLSTSNNNNAGHDDLSRRTMIGGLVAAAAAATGAASVVQPALAEDAEMFAPKFVQQYDDFTETASGWRYRDVQVGKPGPEIQEGDRVVFDWSGYTIGYFGRPFQAKGGPQGGAFDKDLDYSRTVVGSHQVVLGLEQALADMKVGGIRQVVIPYGPLSYPADDSNHDRVGPKPTTFSGNRALNFVLDNPRVDRTILFNVKLIRVDKPNGKGGFLRG